MPYLAAESLALFDRGKFNSSYPSVLMSIGSWTCSRACDLLVMPDDS